MAMVTTGLGTKNSDKKKKKKRQPSYVKTKGHPWNCLCHACSYEADRCWQPTCERYAKRCTEAIALREAAIAEHADDDDEYSSRDDD